MIIFALTFCFCLVKLYDCYPSAEALHESMTESELAYIFNTNDKSNVAEYEVVYLPVFKIRESVSEGNEEGSIDYELSAFGRYPFKH